MLKIDSIKKQYGAVTVLQNVDLQAKQGEFLVLLGPSGCGKSTLLGIIAGLEQPSSGDILIADRVVTDLDPKDRDIAMVFQSYALYPGMTVEGNMNFGMEVRGVPKSERQKAVAEAARILKIEQLLQRKPAQLSGGQRQRVAMGRAIVRQPKIFLFDEPLSNLDAQLRSEMRTELKKLHSRLGATIVYVTHDQVEAMTLATKVVVMNGGVVQQMGTPQSIYDRPANVFVAKFIGSPSMNLIPGVLGGSQSEPVFIGDGGAVPVRLEHSDRTLEIGRRVLLGIRPESIAFAADVPVDHGTALPMKVELVETTGSDNLTFVKLGTAEVLARLPANSSATGQEFSLVFPKDKLLVYDEAEGTLLY